MFRFNAGYFYDLRGHLQAIIDLREGQPISEVSQGLIAASGAVETAVGQDIIPLKTAAPAGRRLMSAIRDVLSKAPSVDGSPATLSRADVLTLGYAFMEYNVVLRNELAIMDTYALLPKGIYSVFQLAEQAEAMLSSDVRTKIPDSAVANVKQAGKCLAFEVSTAAAFHMLRATETVVIEYLSTLAGAPIAPKSRSWGTYIRLIEARGGDKKIVAMLKQIKDLHRNPIMHPEDMLGTDEAVAVFGIATSAIAAMAKLLP